MQSIVHLYASSINKKMNDAGKSFTELSQKLKGIESLAVKHDTK